MSENNKSCLNKNTACLILGLGAEGGSLNLYGREGDGGQWTYWLEMNTCWSDILPDEDMDDTPFMSEQVTLWEEALALLNDMPYWLNMVPMFVHQDFRSRILDAVLKYGGQEKLDSWLENTRFT
jgi:hypothetical protein